MFKKDFPVLEKETKNYAKSMQKLNDLNWQYFNEET